MRARGFSLLEALVAMAIAALAFAALYRTVGQSSKVVVDVDARVEASLLARSVLASATFAEDLAQLSSGREGPWHWSLQLLPETIALQAEGGEQLDIEPVPAARVQLQVMRDGLATPVLSWTGWKPMREAGQVSP